MYKQVVVAGVEEEEIVLAGVEEEEVDEHAKPKHCQSAADNEYGPFTSANDMQEALHEAGDGLWSDYEVDGGSDSGDGYEFKEQSNPKVYTHNMYILT